MHNDPSIKVTERTLDWLEPRFHQHASHAVNEGEQGAKTGATLEPSIN